MDKESFRDKRKFAALVGGIGTVLALLTAIILGGNIEELALAVEIGIYTTVIVGGTYAIGLKFGPPHSHAVATAGMAFGALYLVAVAFRLVTEFGVPPQRQVAFGIAAALLLGISITAGIAALGRFGPSPN